MAMAMALTDNSSNKLPKNIQLMIEKNNLVMAIKELASEHNISMDEAKTMIDDYEEDVKQKRLIKQNEIIKKQEKKTQSLIKRLDEQGMKKSLAPYLAKTIAIIALGVLLMSLVRVFFD